MLFGTALDTLAESIHVWISGRAHEFITSHSHSSQVYSAFQCCVWFHMKCLAPDVVFLWIKWEIPKISRWKIAVKVNILFWLTASEGSNIAPRLWYKMLFFQRCLWQSFTMRYCYKCVMAMDQILLPLMSYSFACIVYGSPFATVKECPAKITCLMFVDKKYFNLY